MKITAVEALRYSPPPLPPAPGLPRRPSWHGRQDVSHPLARYRGSSSHFGHIGAVGRWIGGLKEA